MTKTNKTVHEILREIPYGMYVVGVKGDDGNFNGLIVSWLTQCSFDPPLLMIALRRGTRSLDLVREGKVFSVNFLDKSDEDLARQFVKPADQVGNKLATVEHIQGETGAPILQKAFAYLECKVRDIHEPGDHAILIGDIVSGARHGAGEALMCADLRWHYAG